MDGGSDNNITDSNISGSSTYDVSMSEGSKNAIFLNVTYDESLENVGAGSGLIRRWRYGLQVTYPSGNHYVPNAQVAAYNSTGDLVENLTTNGTGWTVSSSLIDYVRMGGTKDYYSNYTINASHPDHLSASKSYNVTAEGENLNDSIPLGGLFSLKESSPETDNTHHVAIADLNNDGYLDYIAGNTGQNRIYLNDGTGHFTLSESSPESDDTPTLAIADLDNDGDQDYIAGNYQQLNRIYLNNGTGNFTLHENNTETGIERTQSLAIADLDNDGDLDYIAANSNAPVQIYKNNGSASFTIYQNISGQYYAAALGDFNGDGYTDLVIGGVQSYMTRVYFNNGSGYFVLDDTFPDNTLYTYDVTVGDIDNDGHLDIIEGNGNTLGNQQDRVFLNDGSGKFNLRQSLGDKNTWSIAIADLNNDGYLDFIEGNYQQGNEIYMNNGSGYFNSYEESQTGDGFSVAAADLDLDGDLDYISSYSSNQANRIYLNGKNDNRYVKLYIRGLGSYVGRDGVGTKVSAYLGSSLLGYREVTAADDSQDGTNQLHFGLASTGTYTINATFITGKVVSCTVQPAESFTVYENGSATGGVSCYVVDFPPGISFMQPFDGNITTDIDINFSCDVYDDNQLASITIYIWNASDDIFYSDTRPISGIQNQSSWLVQAMVPDTYKWNCRVLDNASKFNQRPSNYSFRVVVENNLYLKLVINNTDNIVYIPGEGEFNSSSLADQIYSNPPHYYLASYLGNVVSGLVFSMQIPGAVRVGRNASGNTHYIALDQDLERSSVFLVFTLGDWKVIENRIALIEAGRFLTNILPSFSYGLGNKYSLDLALGYADIDLRGRLRLLKGSHKIVIENNGTSAGKPVVVISRE